MTTPELITDEIIEKACRGYNAARGLDTSHKKKIKAAILAIQDDITRPVYNILQGWKQNSNAYEFGLKAIIGANEGSKTCIYCGLDDNEHKYICPVHIAKSAFNGEYHEPREE